MKKTGNKKANKSGVNAPGKILAIFLAGLMVFGAVATALAVIFAG